MLEHNALKDFEQTRFRLAQSDGLPFSELLPAAKIAHALAEHGEPYRRRIYTAPVTLWTFLSQVLSQDHSCRDAVARVFAWRVSQNLKSCSTNPGSYCEARQRLPLEAIRKVARDTAGEAEATAETAWLWKGRHVKIVDGTTATMADTPANQNEYPQRRNQKQGVGFPIARIVVIFSLACGTVLDAIVGPMRGKKTGETTLFRQIQSLLKVGDVLLGDRLFASYQDLATLRSQGADVVARQHASRRTDFRRGHWLATGDHVVVWRRPRFKSARVERDYWEALPKCMEVRELRFKVVQKGFRPSEITLVTTLLDSIAYSKDDLCELYRERWHCELDLRSIKTSLQMGHLRCKSPEMVEKEIWVHFLAYNLIRQTMAEAARAHSVLPRHLSFKGACQFVNSFAVYLAMEPSFKYRLWSALLFAIAQHEVGDRPNRIEPRALKYRQGKYPYMTQPRNELRKQLCA
jgi:hypothetical protein